MTDSITFPDSTARFKMPLLHVAQAQKEIFVNEALIKVDALLQPVVEGITDEPHVTPTDGECWIVSTSPNGSFTGYANAVACWQQNQWNFITPRAGLSVYDRSLGAYRRFNDEWTVTTPIARPAGGSVVDVEARAAIDAVIQCLIERGSVPKA